MTTVATKAKKILQAIDERTDMMVNAIVVDQFEVFEKNLEARQSLIEDYEALEGALTVEEKRILDLEGFSEKMMDVDLKIKNELLRYQKQLELEQIDTQRQKNKLTQVQKKTNQYHQVPGVYTSGHHFDKQK